MEGRRTRGRAAAEKAAVAAAASEQHVPQLSEPDEAEAEADETAGEPWRRPVTESVLRRIITIRPNVLRRQFGWRPQTGAPRMALSIAGQRLEAGVQTVMQFNKEGRDGFPWKSHWVGRLLDKLGPRLGDTLLLQKQRVDADGLIHVEVSLERGAGSESSGSDGSAGIAAAARASVGAALVLAPRPSASSLGSAWDSGSELEQPSASSEEEQEEGEEEGAEEQQQRGGEEEQVADEEHEPPPKRRRSTRHGAGTQLHQRRRQRARGRRAATAAAALSTLGHVSVQAAQRRVEQALQAFDEAGDSCTPESMLRPLRLLALVGHGGTVLQGLLERWGSLGLEQQQQVFDAALVAAGQGAWPELEARLQAALGRPCDARS